MRNPVREGKAKVWPESRTPPESLDMTLSRARVRQQPTVEMSTNGAPRLHRRARMDTPLLETMERHDKARSWARPRLLLPSHKLPTRII